MSPLCVSGKAHNGKRVRGCLLEDGAILTRNMEIIHATEIQEDFRECCAFESLPKDCPVFARRQGGKMCCGFFRGEPSTYERYVETLKGESVREEEVVCMQPCLVAFNSCKDARKRFGAGVVSISTEDSIWLVPNVFALAYVERWLNL